MISYELPPSYSGFPIISHSIVTLGLEWPSKTTDMRKGTPLVICAAEQPQGFKSTIRKVPCKVLIKLHLLIVSKASSSCMNWKLSIYVLDVKSTQLSEAESSVHHDKEENVSDVMHLIVPLSVLSILNRPH